MQIKTCSSNDVDTILYFYEAARTLQKEKGTVIWPLFERDFVQNEVDALKHWKLIENDVTVCVWCVSPSDPNIWKELERADAIYLHRIVTHPEYKHNRYIDSVVEWSRSYVTKKGRQFVRLDTVASNQGLRKHYLSAGFTLVRTVHVSYDPDLPEHYNQSPVRSLFEIRVK